MTEKKTAKEAAETLFHLVPENEPEQPQSKQTETPAENKEQPNESKEQPARKKDGTFAKGHQVKARAVKSVNLITGEEKVYRSVTATEADGFSFRAVHNCAVGKTKSHKGHRWIFVDQEQKNEDFSYANTNLYLAPTDFSAVLTPFSEQLINFNEALAKALRHLCGKALMEYAIMGFDPRVKADVREKVLRTIWTEAKSINLSEDQQQEIKIVFNKAVKSAAGKYAGEEAEDIEISSEDE